METQGERIIGDSGAGDGAWSGTTSVRDVPTWRAEGHKHTESRGGVGRRTSGHRLGPVRAELLWALLWGCAGPADHSTAWDREDAGYPEIVRPKAEWPHPGRARSTSLSSSGWPMASGATTKGGPTSVTRVDSALAARSLCRRGDRVRGDLRIEAGSWDRSALACLRVVDGVLTLDLSGLQDTAVLSGLETVGTLTLIGDAADLLAAVGNPVLAPNLVEAETLEVRTENLRDLDLAPNLGSLDHLYIDDWALERLGPTWNLDTIESLTVEDGAYFLDLQAIQEVSEITGSAYVQGSGGNVDGLQGLRHVGGDFVVLHVRPNTELSLRGLETVGGALDISMYTRAPAQFPALRTAGSIHIDVWYGGVDVMGWTGFDSLEEVAGDLHLGSEFHFEVSGFPVLVRVGGDLDLRGMGLTSLSRWGLSGMRALQEVGGNVHIDAVGSEQILPALERIGGELHARTYGDHPALEMNALEEVGSFAVGYPDRELYLPSLRHVTGDVTIWPGAEVWMGPIDTIEGTLSIGQRGRVATSLDTLRELGALDITGCVTEPSLELPSLEAADALHFRRGITTTTEPYSYATCDEIRLPALQGTTALTLENQQDLRVVYAPLVGELAHLRGDHLFALEEVDLSNLRRVEGDIALEDPWVLHTVHLENLESAGLVDLVGAAALTHLDLSSLTSAEELRIEDFNRLSTLSLSPDLDQLGTLAITGTPRLRSLPALPALSRLTGDLILHDNAQLSNITGLYGLTNIDGLMQVTDNPWLPTEQAGAVLDGLWRTPDGGVIISGNR